MSVPGIIVCHYRMGPLSEFRQRISCVLCPASVVRGSSQIRIVVFPNKVRSSLFKDSDTWNFLKYRNLGCIVCVILCLGSYLAQLSEVLSHKFEVVLTLPTYVQILC